MKILFIIGVLLLIAGFWLSSAANKPLTGLSALGEKTVTFSIVSGFLLIGISSVLYLKKQTS